MFHYLTIGFLDPNGVRTREIVTSRPLPAQLLAELAPFLDADQTTYRMDGQPVIVTDSYVKCPWWIVSKRVRNAERFALLALRHHGCVIADVEHARVVSLQELTQDDLP